MHVLLADGHAQMRRSLRSLLDAEDDIDVVGEAEDLTSLTGEVLFHHPDVVVLDLGAPGSSGIEAIGQLRERAPEAAIVALSGEQNPIFAQRVLTAGACAYASRDLVVGELADTIRASARGEQFVSPPVSARLEALHRRLTDYALTPREVEVLRLIALGHTSVEIARALCLSPRTVETHRSHIHKKLGLATRAELVRYALRRGLLGN